MTGMLDISYPDPQSSTGLMLWRVTNSWQREIRAALAPFRLTHVQFVLLAVLTAMDSNTVTPAGVALANRANAAVEQADRAYFSTLGGKGRDFTNCLAMLSAAVGASGRRSSNCS